MLKIDRRLEQTMFRDGKQQNSYRMSLWLCWEVFISPQRRKWVPPGSIQNVHSWNNKDSNLTKLTLLIYCLCSVWFSIILRSLSNHFWNSLFSKNWFEASLWWFLYVIIEQTYIFHPTGPNGPFKGTISRKFHKQHFLFHLNPLQPIEPTFDAYLKTHNFVNTSD